MSEHEHTEPEPDERSTAPTSTEGRIVPSATSGGQKQLRKEDEVEERKDKGEERVEDLEVRDDEARDIAGGKKKARARAGKSAKAVGHGHGYGVTKQT